MHTLRGCDSRERQDEETPAPQHILQLSKHGQLQRCDEVVQLALCVVLYTGGPDAEAYTRHVHASGNPHREWPRSVRSC